MKEVLDPEHLTFRETAFDLLMQKRIRNVLLLCSSYDAFVLEEDGRVDEQIFNEYVSLHLRNAPSIVQADTAEKVFDIFKTNRIDLVISMLSIRDYDPFSLTKKIKLRYPHVPIVMLTPFSREVSLRLRHEDLSAIDSVFCWLGNGDLLVAIVKLIEDRMNAPHDIEEIGVQCILLVEDSVRYTSSYLPVLYKLILKQSRQVMREALNEHQKMLRMRGRPKILHASTYNEAVELYHRYKNNLLGVISDVTFKKEGAPDTKVNAGFDLCRLIRTEDPNMPILLQSSDMENARYANELQVGFIHKYAKNLSSELSAYINEHFGFGDFIFCNLNTREEIARATDLKSLREQLWNVPDDVVIYHSSRNHISKWFNARGLFSIARVFKALRFEDFSDVQAARKYMDKAMSIYMVDNGRGIITQFDKENFNEFMSFARIGHGAIGGKARGLAFMDTVIKKEKIYNKYPGIVIDIPRTVVIGADIFEEFIESNHLYPIAISDAPDKDILQAFLAARLPARLKEDLAAFASIVKTPIAARSSSKLEDSHYQPFAGIYSTYMLPNASDPAVAVKNIVRAVKAIYASVFYSSSKSYIAATSNIIDEEKMSVVLQELCGTRYGNRFYPTISGVARSVNFYPIAPETIEDGVANIALGLGKYVVEGGAGIRFSPQYPDRVLQLSTLRMALNETQKYFYALDLTNEDFTPDVDECSNIIKLPVSAAERDKTTRFVASTYDDNSGMIRDGIIHEGKRIITFSKVLQHKSFPLANILNDLLKIGQREMNTPVEIEFAVNLDVPPGNPRTFDFLQIRPVVSEQRSSIHVDNIPKEDILVRSEWALGNGEINHIYDVVYVKTAEFNPVNNPDIALSVEKINAGMAAGKRNYILCGPGRWGSSDPWLGIPVKWQQISEARLIVESGLHNYRIDASQGTHFFQNLTSFHIGYFTINTYLKDGGVFDADFFDALPAIYEDKYIRHVRCATPLQILIDGKHMKGVVLKPK
ncbi:MAG: phosphoenolpyruvate synthase [Bacteroidales bacterium]|jgi:DNA-binding NarL/FixJ family response regulator|nr:phosphoenolpyruvate synthase [Bacteroidales bacterium]